MQPPRGVNAYRRPWRQSRSASGTAVKLKYCYHEQAGQVAADAAQDGPSPAALIQAAGYPRFTLDRISEAPDTETNELKVFIKA